VGTRITRSARCRWRGVGNFQSGSSDGARWAAPCANGSGRSRGRGRRAVGGASWCRPGLPAQVAGGSGDPRSHGGWRARRERAVARTSASERGAQVASERGAHVASERGAHVASERGAHVASERGAHVASERGAHVASERGAHVASERGAHVARERGRASRERAGRGGNADHQIRTLPMEGRGEAQNGSSDASQRGAFLPREESEAERSSPGRRWRSVTVPWATGSSRRRIW
jgi:hypothetical protein